MIYNSCQLLFSIINSSFFPTQQTNVNAFLLPDDHQIPVVIHYVAKQHHHVNALCLATKSSFRCNQIHIDGQPFPAFFLFFVFFFKKLQIQKSVSIDCRGFFPREIRPRISSLRFGVNTLANKRKFVTQIPSMPLNHFKFKTVSD